MSVLSSAVLTILSRQVILLSYIPMDLQLKMRAYMMIIIFFYIFNMKLMQSDWLDTTVGRTIWE